MGKNDYNKRDGNRNQDNRNNDFQKYVGAPYNFVSFSDYVHEYKPEQLVSHGEMTEGDLTGEITYKITAKTPIMVSQGVENKGKPEQFYRDLYGRFAIPGSTMRGLIRNNVQILGLCSMSDDIDDYALMYRNVAKGVEKKRYAEVLGAVPLKIGKNEISVLKNVKAGYMKEENGKYVIYPTCIDGISVECEALNYYVLSERAIIKNYLDAEQSGVEFDYPFFEMKDVLQNKWKLEPEDKGYGQESGFEKKVEIDKNNKKRIHYIREGNKKYIPYYKEIFYSIQGTKTVDKVTLDNPDGTLQRGYVLSSGYMNEKKAVYIIPEIDNESEERIVIPDSDINAFRIDYRKRLNVLGSNKKDKTEREKIRDFFNLPKEGETKPVFYICLNGKMYFGFTPRLRLFYDHTIKAGLNEKHKEGMLDYAKAMFGYSKKDGNYKSRVSFSDAVIVGEAGVQKEVRLVLGEPKPTSYCDYLMPNEKGKAATYNTKGFQLRGVKQYWLKPNAFSGGLTDNKNVQTVMKPLPEKTSFIGKVRFKNLKPDELGLLLWSLKLNKGSLMNVGKGKAFGYGKISLELLSVKSVDMKKAYNSGTLCLNPWTESWTDIQINEKIGVYKEAINTAIKEALNGTIIDELPHIKEFFYMKDAECIPDARKTRYMSLKEYTGRRDKVLPDVKSVIFGK